MKRPIKKRELMDVHVLTEPVRVVDGQDAHKLVVFELHREKVAISDDSIFNRDAGG